MATSKVFQLLYLNTAFGFTIQDLDTHTKKRGPSSECMVGAKLVLLDGPYLDGPYQGRRFLKVLPLVKRHEMLMQDEASSDTSKMDA